MNEKPYEPILVCPYCGHRPESANVPMYPTGKPGPAYHCRSHGLLMSWELIAEAAWPKQEKFLKSKAGRLDMLLPGDR